MTAEHTHARASFGRAFAVGIALNTAFVAVEAYYGWRVNSLALLADAAHNLSDVAGLVLAWGGALAGRLRPDARHTYGWKGPPSWRRSPTRCSCLWPWAHSPGRRSAD